MCEWGVTHQMIKERIYPSFWICTSWGGCWMVGLGSIPWVWSGSMIHVLNLLMSFVSRYLPYAPPPHSEMIKPRGGQIHEFISDVYEASYWSNSFNLYSTYPVSSAQVAFNISCGDVCVFMVMFVLSCWYVCCQWQCHGEIGMMITMNNWLQYQDLKGELDKRQINLKQAPFLFLKPTETFFT